MSLKQFLDVRQSLSMTQDLQESIKILQYSTIDLISYIDQQIENNPFLTIEEPNKDDNDIDIQQSSANEDNLDFEDYVSSAIYDDDLNYSTSDKSIANYADNLPLEQKLVTLREHVLSQVNIIINVNREKIIASLLVEMLDDNGYIEINYEHIIKAIKCSKKEIDHVLEKLQSFDPPGIFSRSLAECLLLQLKDRGVLTEKLSCLLECLELVAKAEFNEIKKKCSMDLNELKKNLAIIKSLNPKPGNVFDVNTVQVIQPDIFLRKIGNKWVVELNNDFMPRVIVNKDYYKEAKIHTKEKESKKYLSQFYNSASWLISSLSHRSETLMKVAVAIVEKQQDFFDKGINYLHPLSLNDVSTEIGISTSTVSRITSNKYISTPIGMFELKYFFSSSLPSNRGESIQSNKAVKHLIKAIIDKEQPNNIYSDNDIVGLLKDQSIEISRRTVTKYRERMNIPSSSERKKNSKLLSLV